MRRILIRSALLVAAPCFAMGARALTADPTIVSQKGRAFTVRSVQIEPGGTIRFTNDDDFAHQLFVQSPGFSYESDEQEPGHTVDVRFPKAGTFDVQCHIHPKMHLRVDVR